MAQLPPIAWHEFATKADLASLATRAELAEVRTDVRLEIAELRTELAGLRAEMYRGFTRQTRWMITFALAWSTVLVTAKRLIP